MSKPTITETVSGYRFEWVPQQLCIDVSRLHTHTDGRVVGEIAVTTTTEDIPPHIHQAQYNFSSSRSRKELANILNERYSADWFGMLEQLSASTLAYMRRGEPVKELWSDDAQIHAPEYLLNPLVIKNYPNILFGDPSAGKSLLAVILAHVMTIPWQEVPLNVRAPQSAHQCLYLDWETDEDTIQWQTHRLAKGMDLGKTYVHYRRCAAPVHQDIEAILNVIDECSADVLILDSLGLAAGGDLNAPETALTFYAALRRFKRTTLILAHNNKDNNAKTRTIFGSQFFTAGARNIWELRKKEEDGSPMLHMALFHRKPPPFAGRAHPIGLQLEFDEHGESFQIEREEPKTVEAFLEQMTVQTRILTLLAESPLTAKQIATELDLTEGHINKEMSLLKKDGKVVKLEGNRFGLLSQYSL